MVQDHLTLGFTANMGEDSEIMGAFTVTLRKTTTGPSLLNAVLGAGAAGHESISMHQTSLRLA